VAVINADPVESTCCQSQPKATERRCYWLSPCCANNQSERTASARPLLLAVGQPADSQLTAWITTRVYWL